MSAIEELMQAALMAPEQRRSEALRVLRGDTGQMAEAEPGPEPYLTLREVGRRLGLSPCTLWRYQAPGHELGGRRRFRLSEVQAYLESDQFKQRAAELRENRKHEQEK